MRRLYDFQKFDPKFFDSLDLAVVADKDKEDRKTITVIILEDRNEYNNDEHGVNRYEKFYINILNPNFKEFNFKEGQPFLIDYLEPGFNVVVWGENFDRKISIKGFLKAN